MKMYKDPALTIPALCPFRGMQQCVSECALYIDDYADKGDCIFKGKAPVWMYPGKNELAGVDGRE